MLILPQFEYIHLKIEALKRSSNGVTYKKISAKTFVGDRQRRKCVSILKYVKDEAKENMDCFRKKLDFIQYSYFR